MWASCRSLATCDSPWMRSAPLKKRLLLQGKMSCLEACSDWSFKPSKGKWGCKASKVNSEGFKRRFHEAAGFSCIWAALPLQWRFRLGMAGAEGNSSELLSMALLVYLKPVTCSEVTGTLHVRLNFGSSGSGSASPLLVLLWALVLLDGGPKQTWTERPEALSSISSASTTVPSWEMAEHVAWKAYHKCGPTCALKHSCSCRLLCTPGHASTRLQSDMSITRWTCEYVLFHGLTGDKIILLVSGMNFSSMALLGMVPMRISHNFGEEIGWAPLRLLQLQSFKMKRFREEGGRKGTALIRGWTPTSSCSLLAISCGNCCLSLVHLTILANHAGDTVLDLLLAQWRHSRHAFSFNIGHAAWFHAQQEPSTPRTWRVAMLMQVNLDSLRAAFGNSHQTCLHWPKSGTGVDILLVLH